MSTSATMQRAATAYRIGPLHGGYGVWLLSPHGEIQVGITSKTARGCRQQMSRNRHYKHLPEQRERETPDRALMNSISSGPYTVHMEFPDGDDPHEPWPMPAPNLITMDGAE